MYTRKSVLPYFNLFKLALNFGNSGRQKIHPIVVKFANFQLLPKFGEINLMFDDLIQTLQIIEIFMAMRHIWCNKICFNLLFVNILLCSFLNLETCNAFRNKT